MFITEKEIFATGDALNQTYALFDSKKQEIEGFFAAHAGRKFVFVGCGSSFMLAQNGAALFLNYPNTSTVAIAGGDYMLNPESYSAAVQGSIVVAFSRSGATSEVLIAVERMKHEAGVSVIALTMKEQSALAELADLTMEMPWAFDHSVCQTRNIANLFTSALLLAAICYGDAQLFADVQTAASQHDAFMASNREMLQNISKRDFSNIVVLSDGVLSGLGQAGGLAFTEIALMPGVHFNLLDYRHGPIVINRKDTLTIVVTQPTEKHHQAAMLNDLRKCGGTLVTVGAESLQADADAFVAINGLSRFAAFGIPFIFVCQFLAFSKAVLQGINPDAPSGLNSYIVLK